MTLCLPLLLHSPHNCLSSILCSGPPVPSEVLVPHIDNKARRSRRRCRRTCSAECTLCAQVHTTVRSPARTIQSLCTHLCTPDAESSTTPTQCCAMTAEQPSPAAPHTAAHPRPSPCTHILTRTGIPDLPPSHAAPNRAVPQHFRSPVSTVAHLLYRRVYPCPRKSPYP